jgi:hypothetical protein
MKRRRLVIALAGIPAAGAFSLAASKKDARGLDLENPYEEVDWDQWECLPSMSHQHQGQTDTSREVFREMGYRHFAFSNYYPSAPTYPLPGDYLEKHPGVIAAPNAEHHSFTDTGLHANALGSLLATGYGSDVGAKERGISPLERQFEGLHRFESPRPWLGVYRLDVRLATTDPATTDLPPALLSIEGATECVVKEGFADRGPVRDRPMPPGNHTIYLRTTGSTIGTRLTFDPSALTVTQYRLMQGTNRPWRDIFRAALDGEIIDGRRTGGLLFPDGGGMTLNHPTGKLADYTTMLDFDPRVLGIEVWNQLTSGFGSAKGFYDLTPGPHLHFYQLWDDILRTGRRCWGFFVKDHLTFGRGRNILLVPRQDDLTADERETAALRAYRNGAFFGSMGSLAANNSAEVVAPYDHSEFRFSRLTVRRDADGNAVAIEAAVAGHHPGERPNLQIRFVTDEGVAGIVDGPRGEFPLARDEEGKITPRFVRVEAFAYPTTHLQGEALSPEMFARKNVHEISLLHDMKAPRGQTTTGNSAELRSPIPLVDMIFSQPMRRV